jgi:hypothetical protein
MRVIPRSVSAAALAISAACFRLGIRERRFTYLRGASLVALLVTTGTVYAEGGDGDRALPALGHIALGEQRPTGRITAAGTVGFGLTESQGAGDGLHERLSSRLAVSAYAAPWLAFGLLGDGRYDRHPKDAGGVDDGWLFRPELCSRASAALGQLRVGVDVAAWVPAGSDLGSSFKGLSLDSRVLVSHRAGAFTVGGQAGYRVDRSVHGVGNTATLRRGDRIALGASDFNALLAGLGVSYDLGQTELFGETTADLLVGSGAPSVGKSPIRVTAGVRQALGGEALSAELMLDALLSGRPDSGPLAALAPIEPRTTLWIGLRYRFGMHAASAAPPPEAAPPPIEKATPAPAATPTSLEVSLTDEQGKPLENATVELVLGDRRLPLTPNGPGHYRLEGAPTGRARLHVHADGRQDTEREITLEPGGALNLDVQSQPALPAGQVRGLVRSFRGKALAAKVRVEPAGVATTTDHDGFFQIDVPPGDYEVVIEAPGFAAQRRKAHVEKQGVVIVNADLSQGP